MTITFTPSANRIGRFLPKAVAWFFVSIFSVFSYQSAIGQQARKASNKAQEYVAITVYHAADTVQLASIETYLQTALLPSLTKNNFKRIGVFKAINNDTASDKRLYVLVPFQTLPQLSQLTAISTQAAGDSTKAIAYTKAAYNKPVFTRMERILLQAFAGMPEVKAPTLGGTLAERVYELRSYESATEGLHLNKVKMFNAGEVEIFDRLGFNAVFYGQVIAGGRMPNLMYMTSFANKTIRDEYWKNFGADAAWKALSAIPEYKNNVSKIDITFLRPTAYSQL